MISSSAGKQAIVCFGEALIDFHPEGDDGHGFARAYLPFAGGAQANVAAAVARLGGQARFSGMLGTDRFGDFLLDSLGRAGVDTRHVLRTADAPTALAFVTLDEHGERSFTFYRPPSADMLFREQDFADAVFADTCLFHACSLSMSEPAPADTTCEGMRRARESGAMVSFDLNLRPARWPQDVDPRPQLWRALELADIVKLSAEEMAFMAGDDEQALLDRLWRGHARLLMVTDGAAALRWFGRDVEGELPVYQTRAVDSTAAGDAFVAGLMFRMAEQHIDTARLDALIADLPRLHATMRYAAACGAITASRRGSLAAVPTAHEVEAFMEAQA